MDTPQFDMRTATENQILRHQAQREADRVADHLEKTANRIRMEALQFTNESRPAAAVVADVIKSYTNGTGSAGPMFWNMIRELSRMT